MSFKLPFIFEIIQCLDNGNFIFGLSSWNDGINKGDKIVITDQNFNVLQSYLKYDEFIDETYWISDYRFLQTDSHVIYNRPIDNNVYLFSLDGVLQKIYRFDFGRNNVPNDDKKDVEANLSSKYTNVSHPILYH